MRKCLVNRNVWLIIVPMMLALGCTEKNPAVPPPAQPRVVSLQNLSKEPQPADFVSIGEEDFNRILENLKKDAVEDSTLSINTGNAMVITSSPFKAGEYIIHPPYPGPGFDTLGFTVYRRDDILTFRMECPTPDFGLCACRDIPPPDWCMDDGEGSGGLEIPIDRPPLFNELCPTGFNIANWKVDCTFRKACEDRNDTCVGRFRQIKNVELPGGTIVGIYLVAGCECKCQVSP